MLTLDPRSCPEGESEITIDFRTRRSRRFERISDTARATARGSQRNRAEPTASAAQTVVENRVVGMKSRGVYETPGGTLIMAAHRELEVARVSIAKLDIRKTSSASRMRRWSTKASGSRRFREALDAFFAKTQEVVTGSVTMSLYKGTMAVKSREVAVQPVPAGHRIIRYRQLQSS